MGVVVDTDLYPRTASLYSPAPVQSTGGKQGYSGRTAAGGAGPTLKATNIPCSVQARREGVRGPTGLPSDATKASWRIYTPLGAVADGFVQDSDLFIDDLGRKFGVLADYTNVLGGCFYCERLEP